MRAKRYILVILFVSIVVPVGSIFCFNFIVDPHHLWRRDSRMDPVPEMNPHARLSRAYEVRRLHPKHIVLGSSRCVVGIDIDNGAWPEGPRYNLAVFGAGAEEYWAYLRHAQRVEALDTVVLGLDLFSFNVERTSWLPKYEHVLRYRDARLGWQIERLKITCSVSTISDSFQALRARKESLVDRQRKKYGLNQGRYDLHPIRNVFKNSVKRSVERRFFGEKSPGYSFARSGETTMLDFYRHIVTFCHMNEIDLKVFVSPVHAIQMEVIDEIGLWDSFEEWKRCLVDINEQTAQRVSRSPFAIWDFSGYNSITSEAIPTPDDDPGPMKYFLGPGHYKIPVGDMILETLLNKNGTPGFGEPLTADTIEQVLAKIRADRVVWRNQNPDDYEEFRALAQKHRPKKAIIRTD